MQEYLNTDKRKADTSNYCYTINNQKLSKSKMEKLIQFIFLVFILVSLSGCKSLYFRFIVNIAPERFVFKTEGEVLKIQLFTSRSLDTNNNEISHLLIMIHGGGLTAGSYFERGTKVASHLKLDKNKTMIIAPQFLEKGVKHNERGLLFWDSKWRGGGKSLSVDLNEQLPSISSYEVLDQLIQAVIDKNPNTHEILILGHSAGGQFTLRYAAISNLHNFLKSRDINVLHIVANPSSYLYLNKSRYRFNDDGRIVEASSDAIADCPNYNHYKYGLENLYGYSAQIHTDEIKKRLLSRQIMFLLGISDNKRDWGLNKSCAGDAQGNNRYERGLLYKHHLQSLFRDFESNRHIWLEILGVDHDSTAMFTHDDFISKLQDSYL